MAAACLGEESRSAPLLFFLATCMCAQRPSRGDSHAQQPANLDMVQHDPSEPKHLKQLKPSQQCCVTLEMRAPAGQVQQTRKLQPPHAAGSLELFEGPGCHLLPLEQGFQQCKDGHHEAHREAILVQAPLVHCARAVEQAQAVHKVRPGGCHVQAHLHQAGHRTVWGEAASRFGSFDNISPKALAAPLSHLSAAIELSRAVT